MGPISSDLSPIDATYAASNCFQTFGTTRKSDSNVSIVKPRSAFSHSDPQYVIFSDELGDRRQSYALPQCPQTRMCSPVIVLPLPPPHPVPGARCQGVMRGSSA